MTYGDIMMMFLGTKPIPKDLDPRIITFTIADCLDHHPDDVIIFDEEDEGELKEDKENVTGRSNKET